MLDGLFDQDTILDIQEHFTDTGGASDHVFGLFASASSKLSSRRRTCTYSRRPCLFIRASISRRSVANSSGRFQPCKGAA